MESLNRWTFQVRPVMLVVALAAVLVGCNSAESETQVAAVGAEAEQERGERYPWHGSLFFAKKKLRKNLSISPQLLNTIGI